MADITSPTITLISTGRTIVNISCCKFAALIVCILTHSTQSCAVPFGSSNAGSVTVSPCSASTLVSIPITVDVSSLVYATATGVANNQDNFNAYGFSYEMHLRDAGDTIDLATSRGDFFPTIPSGTFLPFSDSQVLTGTSGSYVAAPGSYLLKFVIHASNSCNGTGVFTNGELSYILLSCVSDRIFANGFTMVLRDDLATLTA